MSSYLCYITLGGLASALTQFAFGTTETAFLIGASGAIATVMGAYLIVAPMAKISLVWILGFAGLLVKRVSAAGFLLLWIMIQLMQGSTELLGGYSAGVAWFAHIGGFVVGVFWFVGRDTLEPLREEWERLSKPKRRIKPFPSPRRR